MADPVVICEETWCDGDVKDRTVFRVDDPATEGPRVHLSAQTLWVRSPNECIPAGVWETDQDAGINIPREALANLAMALLPHLTGDELRRVAEAMPRVAGEWATSPSGNFWRVYDDAVEGGPDLAAIVGGDGESHEAITYINSVYGIRVRTTHPTARAAQAACDARLEAAGVRLCGEVVRG